MSTTGTKMIFEDSALSSRYNAAMLRRNIIDMLENQQQDYVSLDYSSVEVMSGCYADELFGVLALQLSYPKLMQKVKVIGANEHILHTIAGAIQKRLGDIV